MVWSEHNFNLLARMQIFYRLGRSGDTPIAVIRDELEVQCTTHAFDLCLEVTVPIG